MHIPREEDNEMHPEAAAIPQPATSATVTVPHKRETLLVVEDDARMQKVLTRVFLDEKYEVIVAADGRAGLEAFEQHRPVAVLLDLLLPEMSGRELCQRIRAIDTETPILIVSAISQVMDKVLLLELGADDYVTKPFSPRELLARLQVALRHRRKPAPASSSTVCFGDCEIDFLKMQARRGNTACNLTAHEYKLLKFLTDNAERVLSREELLNEVWGYNFYPTTRTVDNQILKLRQKLEQDPANPRHLQTIYGAGYRFVL
jgi:two-component system, OmpR family, alkaline phosphatase synthesis response regulator PhoP